MNKKNKITVKSVAELRTLAKTFSWDEIFETFIMDEKILTKALAMARISTAKKRDVSISELGFKKFFLANLIFS